MSETKEAASAEPEVEDAVKERERAKAAKRAERQELRERNQEILIENTQVLFENLAKYLQGVATSGDYRLLQQMNVVTKDKYVEMAGVVTGLTKNMEAIHQKYQDFQPYLKQIDEIEAGVSELEQTVMLLDEYTKRLEGKFMYIRQQQLLQQQNRQTQ